MDNRYFKYNCPPLMNDGRFLTSYVRGRVFDQYVRNVNNINSGNEYKNFLQENGDFIINNLKAHYRKSNTCKIEGRCLPMSGPNNDNMNDYLNSTETNSQWYEQVESMSKMNEYNLENNNEELLFQEQTETKNYDTLNAQKANELAQNIYNNMLVQQEHNNLQQDDNNENCTFCSVKK
jgi:hypothetical protein